VYGEGVQNYMNDAPVDVGVVRQPGNRRTPLAGEALSVLGLVAWLDHRWNDDFTSSIGWSFLDMGTTPDLEPTFFDNGHYALANLLYYPIDNVMMGGELQWGTRENFGDDSDDAPFFDLEDFSDFRIQFSVKVNFAREWVP
jgi:hypothetical protein